MFITQLKRYSSVVWQLVLTDLMIFRPAVFGSMIDTAISTLLLVGTMAYVMPLLGLTQDYGPFAAWGSIPSACFFELYGLVMVLVSDVRTDKSIFSRFILPIPTYLVFVAKALAYACKITANALVAALIGVGMLAIGGRLDLTYFSLWKLLIAIVCITLFTGFFVLFLTSLTKDIYHLNSVWTRILHPLWYLGGAQFSWQTTAAFSPILGYICLLNPIMYLTEGIHAATLDQAKYLNFWACMAIIVVLTFLFGAIGIRLLKRQLQWV